MTRFENQYPEILRLTRNPKTRCFVTGLTLPEANGKMPGTWSGCLHHGLAIDHRHPALRLSAIVLSSINSMFRDGNPPDQERNIPSFQDGMQKFIQGKVSVIKLNQH